jgi:hypothetical protein
VRVSMHWVCCYATDLDIEVDPQRHRLAVSSLTLLFSDWQNASRLKRNESDWLRCRCNGIPVADFGLGSQVFHGCVGIQKAQKAVSQMLDGRVGEVPISTPTMQTVHETWMGLAIGVWGFVIGELATKGL